MKFDTLTYAVINKSIILTDNDCRVITEALNSQAKNDLPQGWPEFSSRRVFFMKDEYVLGGEPNVWPIYIVDDAPFEGAFLGFHGNSGDGLYTEAYPYAGRPYSVVLTRFEYAPDAFINFRKFTNDPDGPTLVQQVCVATLASHEMCEMHVNPQLNNSSGLGINFLFCCTTLVGATKPVAFATKNGSPKVTTWMLKEICDPVYKSYYSYFTTAGSIEVHLSNFTTNNFWNISFRIWQGGFTTHPFAIEPPSGTKFDFMGITDSTLSMTDLLTVVGASTSTLGNIIEDGYQNTFLIDVGLDCSDFLCTDAPELPPLSGGRVRVNVNPLTGGFGTSSFAFTFPSEDSFAPGDYEIVPAAVGALSTGKLIKENNGKVFKTSSPTTPAKLVGNGFMRNK